MTRTRAYKAITITVILMMIAIIFYALEVSKMHLTWGIAGFSGAAILSILSIVLGIKPESHDNEVTKTGFFHTHRFEILDWFSFLSLSMMIIFIIFSFFILPSDVDQNSMYPTLKPEDRILIYHFNYTPKRDDIVILHITKEDYPLVLSSMFYEYDNNHRLVAIHDEIYFVKRIKALPGDRITFISEDSDYYIVVNGEIIYTPTGDKYYVTFGQKSIMEEHLQNGYLNVGEYMTFGDNPNGFTYVDPATQLEVSIPGSFDSRSFGAVKEDDLIGKVIYKLWPLGGVS